jgi:hypothetical protein
MKTKHEITIKGERISITITKVETRFGPVWVPENDYGEPVVVVMGFGSEEEALEEETKSLTTMLS